MKHRWIMVLVFVMVISFAGSSVAFAEGIGKIEEDSTEYQPAGHGMIRSDSTEYQPAGHGKIRAD